MNFLLFNWDFSQKLWHWQNKTRKKLDERCFSNFLSFFMQEKNFNVTLEDVSRDMGMLSLQGPLSRRILQKLTPGNTDLSEEGFPFSTCQTLTVAGHQVHRLENRCLFPNIYNMKNQFWAGLGSRALARALEKKVWGRLWAHCKGQLISKYLFGVFNSRLY